MRPSGEKIEAPAALQRFAFVTLLKPERAAYYQQLHADTWPGVCRKIQSVHIRNYSIYLKEIDGQECLFSYFEYTGDNFADDMAEMARDPETQRWWDETKPCLIPLPDVVGKDEVWSQAREVFHLA